jgi:hypothetical protein
MENIPALLANGYFSSAMKETPDDPAIFKLYWKAQNVEKYELSLIRYNKAKILRYLLDETTIPNERLDKLSFCAASEYYHLSLSIMHVLDKCPEAYRGRQQKRFCKIRLHCRKLALVVLYAGKLNKDYRNVNAIIARNVWGARGYCKMETEIIKKKRFCV